MEKKTNTSIKTAYETVFFIYYIDDIINLINQVIFL